MRRRSQLSCESEFFVRCYVFVRFLTRPPDNLGMPLAPSPQSRIRFAPMKVAINNSTIPTDPPKARVHSGLKHCPNEGVAMDRAEIASRAAGFIVLHHRIGSLPGVTNRKGYRIADMNSHFNRRGMIRQ